MAGYLQTPFEPFRSIQLMRKRLKERNDMRAIFFRKVLIKSIALLFSVLVWGQPALACDDWRWDQTCNLRPEIGRVYDDFDNDRVPF
jgi:hypothetical protein